MGDYQEVMKSLRTALNINNENIWSHIYQEVLYKTLGNDENAEKKLLVCMKCKYVLRTTKEQLVWMKDVDKSQMDFYQ